MELIKKNIENDITDYIILENQEKVTYSKYGLQYEYKKEGKKAYRPLTDVMSARLIFNDRRVVPDGMQIKLNFFKKNIKLSLKEYHQLLYEDGNSPLYLAFSGTIPSILVLSLLENIESIKNCEILAMMDLAKTLEEGDYFILSSEDKPESAALLNLMQNVPKDIYDYIVLAKDVDYFKQFDDINKNFIEAIVRNPSKEIISYLLERDDIPQKLKDELNTYTSYKG